LDRKKRSTQPSENKLDMAKDGRVGEGIKKTREDKEKKVYMGSGKETKTVEYGKNLKGKGDRKKKEVWYT